MKMELSIYADKIVATLSGGNKRKLSTAIALLGDPQIIFLDEPTAGMDPKARRFLWKCVLDSVKEGRSVVLTSHSMEECEALCTTLGIMVNGEFKCMGTTQHLKNKYGEGYMIEAKTRPGRSDEAEEYFRAKYPNAIVKEKLPTLVVFQVPREVKVAEIFAHMEAAKTDRRDSTVYDLMSEKDDSKMIEDYSISQTTLDQLFISFASQQVDVKDEDAVPRTTLLPKESKFFRSFPEVTSDPSHAQKYNELYDSKRFAQRESVQNQQGPDIDVPGATEKSGSLARNDGNTEGDDNPKMTPRDEIKSPPVSSRDDRNVTGSPRNTVREKSVDFAVSPSYLGMEPNNDEVKRGSNSSKSHQKVRIKRRRSTKTNSVPTEKVDKSGEEKLAD